MIKNAQFLAGLQNSNMYFSHTDMDFTRAPADGYHYLESSLVFAGQRYARNITTLLGYTSGFAHWELTGAGTTISATQTNVKVQHSLGTDFLPTSGGRGWGVSGDNGATFDTTATAARVDATTIQLTHASMSTSKARIVQYQYGFTPPGQGTGLVTDVNPTPGLIYDNSPLAIPLTPTVWDIRPTPLSTIPVPTWRDLATTLSPTLSQDTPVMQLGPASDTYQKFVILAISSGLVTTPSRVQIRPNIGAAVNATLVVRHPSTRTGLYIYQAPLGTDANGATNCTVHLDFATNPFATYSMQLYTVPNADLNSQTNTGTNNSTTTSSLTGTCSVNVSAGGFIIAMEAVDTVQNNYAAISSNYAERWETHYGVIADASNCAASATSSFSVTNVVSGNIYMLMASWR
jgi:hypothetical protein